MNWLNTQIEWIKSILSEPGGKGSIKRIISFLVVAAFLQSYLKVAYETLAIVDIPSNWMFLIAGIIGLHILDKYVEVKKTEVK